MAYKIDSTGMTNRILTTKLPEHTERIDFYKEWISSLFLLEINAQIDKEIESQIGKDDPKVLKQKLDFLKHKFTAPQSYNIFSGNEFTIRAAEYTQWKLDKAQSNLLSATKYPQGPTVPHQQFANSISQNLPEVSSSYNFGPSGAAFAISRANTPILSSSHPGPPSFVVSKKAEASEYQQLNWIETFNRLSYELRHEKDFTGEYAHLSIYFKNLLNSAIQFISGEKIAFNEANPQQKAIAVELSHIQVALSQTCNAFENHDQDLALKFFNALPKEIKNRIYYRHWVNMGCPKDKGDDFARVSFQNTDEGHPCYASPQKKDETIRMYSTTIAFHNLKMLDLQKKMQEACKTWEECKSISGSYINSSVVNNAKSDLKKKILHQLANEIVSVFGGVDAIKPQKDDSPEALAKAYVNAYPFIYPFFLQLIPDLTSANELQWKDMGKPSHAIILEPKAWQLKGYRRDIMQETMATLKAGHYFNASGHQVRLFFEPSIYSFQKRVADPSYSCVPGNYKTKIILDPKDCLQVAQDCTERHLKPIVMIAGQSSSPGDDYMTGGGAQESNIYRRTALSFPVDINCELHKKKYYPLTTPGIDSPALYVSNVPVFRGIEADGYPYLSKPFETAFAIAPVTDFNEEHEGHKKLEIVNGQTRMPDAEASLTKAKFRKILNLATEYQHDAVVLVAFGSGYYRNPPQQIYEIAMELITEEFPNSFKEIHIALHDDGSFNDDQQANLKACREAIDIFTSRQKFSAIGATVDQSQV
jgi:uncharacterized protein (TIGR02452 family)